MVGAFDLGALDMVGRNFLVGDSDLMLNLEDFTAPTSGVGEDGRMDLRNEGGWGDDVETGGELGRIVGVSLIVGAAADLIDRRMVYWPLPPADDRGRRRWRWKLLADASESLS